MPLKVETTNMTFVVRPQGPALKLDKEKPSYLSPKEAKEAHVFHRSLPGYQPTPLVALSQLARELGVRQILVKDESHRFGLNAFKGLGASYAMAKVIAGKLGYSVKDVTFSMIQALTKQMKEKITFTTATDGNHGRAVAWAAQQLGFPSVIFLPKGTAEARVQAVRDCGAEAVVTTVNYDQTVKLMEQQAKAEGWEILQDTAWEGYEEVPRWIMQGYTTMVQEVYDQLADQQDPLPTHVFLQAGVGSMAASVVGYYLQQAQPPLPVILIMEPHSADCILESVLQNDQHSHPTKGNLETIMAGLSCGLPNPLAWEVLRDFADAYLSCSDSVAEKGMQILARPRGGDNKIVSGESGAVGIGVLSHLLKDQEWKDLKEQLKLGEEAVVLLFSTEGATDPINYEKVLRSLADVNE